MFRFACFFAVWVCVQPALGILPSIYCKEIQPAQQGRETFVIFEEGIDEYFFDIRQSLSASGSLAAVLLGVADQPPDPNPRLVQFALPKKLPDGNPSCFFSEAKPLLLRCVAEPIGGELRVTHPLTGEVSRHQVPEIAVISSVGTQRSTVVGGSSTPSKIQEVRATHFQIIFQSKEGASDKLTQHSISVGFNRENCKTGELPETPAR